MPVCELFFHLCETSRPSVRIHLHTLSDRPTHRRLPNALVESTFPVLFGDLRFYNSCPACLRRWKKGPKDSPKPCTVIYAHAYTAVVSQQVNRDRKHTSRLGGNSLDFSIVCLISSSNSPSRERRAESAIQTTVDSCQLSKTVYPQLSLGRLTPTVTYPVFIALVDANWYNYHYYCPQQAHSHHTRRPLPNDIKLPSQIPLTVQIHQKGALFIVLVVVGVGGRR
jgi:hypothetical protein